MCDITVLMISFVCFLKKIKYFMKEDQEILLGSLSPLTKLILNETIYGRFSSAYFKTFVLSVLLLCLWFFSVVFFSSDIFFLFIFFGIVIMSQPFLFRSLFFVWFLYFHFLYSLLSNYLDIFVVVIFYSLFVLLLVEINFNY